MDEKNFGFGDNPHQFPLVHNWKRTNTLLMALQDNVGDLVVRRDGQRIFLHDVFDLQFEDQVVQLMNGKASGG